MCVQDVIEELIGTEIVDETDQFVDNLRSEKVSSSLPSEPAQESTQERLLIFLS